MSKRESAELIKDGHSIFIKDLQELGYVPEAVDNWIALMGWSYDDRTEFFTLPDLIEKFSLDRLNPSPAAINFTKLDHFNGLHIRAMDDLELARRVTAFLEREGYPVDEGKLLQIIPILRERLQTLEDSGPIAGFFFKDEVHPNPEQLVPKGMTPEQAPEAARRALQVLEDLPVFTHETAESPLRALAEELGIKAGQLFSILRVAVTGQTVSTPLLESMAIIGREPVLQRVRNAVAILEQMASEKT